MRAERVRWVMSAMFALLSLVAAPARTTAAVGGVTLIPPEGIRVAAVEVRGLEQVGSATVLAAINARPGSRITREQVQADLQTLRDLGFFQTIADPEVEITPEGARIAYVVTEFPRVSSVRFEGNTVLTNEELQAIVSVEPGQLFNRSTFLRQARAIEDAYRARGYTARVRDEVRIEEEGVLIVPIHEVRVADVQIEGLRRVREEVVRQALQVEPGDLLNESELRSDFVRLQRFGLFETIEPDVSFNEEGDVIVGWNLTEGRSRALSLGLSYSPQESLLGTVSFTENNFRGRAEQLRVALNIGSIAGAVGGEVAYAVPSLGSRIGYSARLFSTVEYRFSERLFTGENTDLDRYYERRNGLQVGAARDLGRGRSLSLNSRYEDVKVANLPAQFVQADIPSLDSSLFAVGAQLTRERRDSIFYPTRGDYAAAAADVGLVERGSGGNRGLMARPQVEWRVILPLETIEPPAEPGQTQRNPRVVAARVSVGTAFGTLPFFEQYFVGGVNNLRGYLEDRFWGEHMAIANVELRWPFRGGFVGVLFADAGHAWGTDFQVVDVPGVNTQFRQNSTFSPRFGAGVGVRYLSPLGPLRLDFAYGDRFRTHFTIGQTF